MNPEIAQIIKDQLSLLPDALKKAISETDVTSEIVALKEKHHLMLDQVTSVELDTRLTMIGIEAGEEFIDNIKKHANLSNEAALAVAEDIENSIFSKIRKAVMSETEEIDEAEEESLDKDSILNEIENPTPTFPTKNLDAVKQNTEIFPAIQTPRTLESYIVPNAQIKTIVEQKLSEPTRIPPKEIEVSLKKLPQTPAQTTIAPKKYSADPYKESIV